MNNPVKAIARRRTNADLIADCARLGYLNPDDLVLDPTYGRGVFWRRWRPDRLVTNDLNPELAPPADVTRLPYRSGVFDAVVFDPPYKLNGTGSDADERYGVGGAYIPIADRHALLLKGITECGRVLKPKGRLLVKCQDQVSGGKVRWQTYEATRHAFNLGFELTDSLLFQSYRKQPDGTTQQHARRNYSTLLVFTKPRAKQTT